MLVGGCSDGCSAVLVVVVADADADYGDRDKP